MEHPLPLQAGVVELHIIGPCFVQGILMRAALIAVLRPLPPNPPPPPFPIGVVACSGNWVDEMEEQVELPSKSAAECGL